MGGIGCCSQGKLRAGATQRFRFLHPTEAANSGDQYTTLVPINGGGGEQKGAVATIPSLTEAKARNAATADTSQASATTITEPLSVIPSGNERLCGQCNVGNAGKRCGHCKAVYYCTAVNVLIGSFINVHVHVWHNNLDVAW
jgi:hypothetical protein